MPNRDIVVLGGFGGSQAAVKNVFSQLPADIGATFFLVLRMDPAADERLSWRISSYSKLNIEVVTKAVAIEPGKLYPSFT
jgi:chemotaxis response regulator CheB